ncbi:MAG: hypothetical protein A2939_03210 [Parcubacteria group bacterium RIFCSPLOWO2_01_FULL_48_18]|nr:MAG: hypothetical protein A3J67_01895 [Parcubacteria group bacterium RIFCSPHIGHO2_02_FULL_48_10b]OHB23398.1 MAG: hypothetical protein A2939_03210 [Parcubacteria group bacterium RIFCSPLOWO2_01_FULL_48_18]
MIGVLLAFFGSLFEEASTAIGKAEAEQKKETIYSMAFFSLFWGVVWFSGIILIKQQFAFSAASLPSFIARAIFEIILIHMSTIAIVQSERSVFGFIRTGTMPLLLAVDFLLGYQIKPIHLIGIGVIVMTLFAVFANHGIKKTGLRFVVLSTLFPVVTISLYKYNITHFNSVEAEQFLMSAVLLSYTFFSAMKFGRENPLKLITRPIFFFQSFSHGIGSAVVSFAYLYAPASIITSAKRSSAVLWSLLSGNVYFHERNLLLKLALGVFLAFGLALLAL